MDSAAPIPLPRPVKGPPILQSEVFAMLVWVFAEVMLFSGFISAYNLVGARAPAGWWPPPGDPALPVASTAAASLALLVSGVAVFAAGRPTTARPTAQRALWIAVALAMVFVGYQGFEFRRLLEIGFTLQSSAHGGFFYTIVGAHALHALSAVAALGWGARELQADRLSAPAFTALRIYWYFVVLLWPALFTVVYL